MLTNMENQLREQGASDKFDEVLAEIPRVREDLGLHPTGNSYFSDRWYSGSYQRTDGRALQNHL